MGASRAGELADGVEAAAGGVEMHVVVEDGENGHEFICSTHFSSSPRSMQDASLFRNSSVLLFSGIILDFVRAMLQSKFFLFSKALF